MPRHRASSAEAARQLGGDADQVLVGEDHVGRHGLLPGHGRSPLPQGPLRGRRLRRRFDGRTLGPPSSEPILPRADALGSRRGGPPARSVTARWGRDPSSSPTNGDGAAGVGQHDDLAPGPGEGDVEDAALPLLVVGQPVGEKALGGAEDDHVPPLLALDAVHRGQQHVRALGRRAGQHPSQPRLERGRLGMEGGHRLEGHQVVGVGRPVRLPPRRIR